MTEYTIFTYPLDRVYCYPVDVACYSFTTTPEGKGYQRQSYMRKTNNLLLDFYKTDKTLLEMGLKVFMVGTNTFLYVRADAGVRSTFIDHVLVNSKRTAIFYETSNTISALGYSFRNGASDKGYYLDTPHPNSKCQFYRSKSIKELGYMYVNDFDGKSGYLLLDTQVDGTDIIQELFKPVSTPKSIFPPYLQHNTFAGYVDGYTYTTKEGKTGYHKDNHTYNTDTYMMKLWFSRLTERALEIEALKSKFKPSGSDEIKLKGELRETKARVSKLVARIETLESDAKAMAMENQSQAHLISDLVSNKANLVTLQDDMKHMMTTINCIFSINEEQTKLLKEQALRLPLPQQSTIDIGDLLLD